MRSEALQAVARLERTPWRRAIPATTTYGMLRAAAQASDVGSARRRLFWRVTQAANALQRGGVQVGQAVTILLPQGVPERQVAVWAAQAVGIASPLDPVLAVAHLEGVVRVTGSRSLVTLAPRTDEVTWNKAVELVERTPTLRTVFTIDSSDGAPRPPRRRSDDAVSSLDRRDVQCTDLRAALLRESGEALHSYREIAEDDLCTYRHLGGPPSAPRISVHSHLNEAFGAWCGPLARDGYGPVAGTGVAAGHPAGVARKPGSVGVRIPHQQLRVVRVDGRGRWTADCAPGETGVITFCGPNVFQGYLRADHNAGLWTSPGWVNSGDRGHLDAEGHLFLAPGAA